MDANYTKKYSSFNPIDLFTVCRYFRKNKSLTNVGDASGGIRIKFARLEEFPRTKIPHSIKSEYRFVFLTSDRSIRLNTKCRK